MNRAVFWGSVGVLALLIVALFSEKSVAQNANCAPRTLIVEKLKNDYGETVVGQGVVTGGEGLMELFVNTETGTWTAVMSHISGTSCLASSGEGWTNEPYELEETY